MLRRMTARQFLEWQAYAALEPFGEVRDDYRAASIISALVNINRDPKKHPQPFPISDFLLKFGEDAEERKGQTWEQQKAALMQFVAMHNAMVQVDQEQQARIEAHAHD